jgi:hypothetical protein
MSKREGEHQTNAEKSHLMAYFCTGHIDSKFAFHLIII